MNRSGQRAASNLTWAHWRTRVAVCLAISCAVLSGACFSSEEGETYYGRIVVPQRQEFRWSDGGLPQVFDPALAAAPPDTDVVRAMFEGLTEYDPRTLAPISGVALRWTASADEREWIFYLRHDSRWSNGQPVTAHDFVRSWRRTMRLGERAPHAKLLANLEGAPKQSLIPAATNQPPPERSVENDVAAAAAAARPVAPAPHAPLADAELGVEAADDYTLKVHLQRPDKNFPALVAHPVFRPVYEPESVERKNESTTGDENGAPRESDEMRLSDGAVISNGAFQLSEQAADGVVLKRANSYWNSQFVSLERVRFVAASNAESALSAYRAGEVDAVTNVSIEPLAMKLLTPYQDFRRVTFGALTFYDFNATRAPFADLRVRQALSLAIDRKRLSTDTLGGAMEAAEKFLPFGQASDGAPGEVKDNVMANDAARARRLLAAAGFPGGHDFPRIRLLVNRNEQHRTVATAIAAMWRNVLGIETEIRLRNWDEYETALGSGDYDVARRSIIMQTVDEETNMLAMFDPARLTFPLPAPPSPTMEAGASPETSPSPRAESGRELSSPDEHANPAVQTFTPPLILTERQALAEMPALPIYFASSYALVKPYVTGFDANLLDAPSLQHVRIDNNWQPPTRDSAITVVGNR